MTADPHDVLNPGDEYAIDPGAGPPGNGHASLQYTADTPEGRARVLAVARTALETGDGRSLKHRAVEAHVAPSAVWTVTKVLRRGVPAVVEAWSAGQISLYTAEYIAGRVPRDQQVEALRTVRDDNRSRGRHRPGSLLNRPGEREKGPRPVTAPVLTARIGRVLDMLDVSIETLSDLLRDDGVAWHPSLDAWRLRIDSARGDMAKIVMHLDGMRR